MEEYNLARELPKNLEAEQSVIGSLIMDDSYISEVEGIVAPEDFYYNDMRLIYEAILALNKDGKNVDMVMLKSCLSDKGNLEKIGGMASLSKLALNVPTSVNAKHYAGIVKEKSRLREIIHMNEELIASAYSNKEKASDILVRAEKKIFDAALDTGSEDFYHVKDLITPMINKIEQLSSQSSRITGLETGFTDLDAKTSGLQKSDLILIAARPSMGKTAIALNIVQHIATRGKKTCAIFSLEMSKEQLLNRMVCSESLVDSQKLATGTIRDEDWEKLAMGAVVIADANIYIDDTAGITLAEMRSKCRKLKVEQGLDLIAIDYLQLMSGSGKTSSREQEISEISRGLKALAREMGVPVIALSQLSRAPELRADKRPMLSDLRESGAIEQDADVVMFLYRDNYYNKESEMQNISELIIAKQRNGPTGTVQLIFAPQYTKFRNSTHTN